MKKTLQALYQNQRPAGVYPMCNWGGVVLYNLLPDDTSGADYISAYSMDGVADTFRRCRVHYTASGRAYITKGALRVYLDEVMRCEGVQ